MNNRLQNFVQSHTKLNYFQRCLRRSKDSDFVNEVLEIGKNPLRIKIACLGEKNPGRLVYIAQTMGCDGFFAELRFILAEIFYAEKFGMTPVVLMPQASFYCEDHPINGTTNPFEYYFEPVSDISVEDAFQSAAVVEHNYYQRLYIESIYNMNSGYLPSEGYMVAMAEIVKKYLHLNNFSGKKIWTDISSIINGKKTLGVHVRGADFKRHYLNHPNMISVDEYINVTKEVIRNENYDQIFLATDDLEAITKFKECFGHKIIYYLNVVRTDGDETVMKSNSSRENHHYNLGLEVIRDMYTLSECEGIIAGLSNVSIFARIVKLSNGEDYKEKIYLDKGIKR